MDSKGVLGFNLVLGLFASHPSFRHQNVLLSYLKRNSVAKEEIVQWILDMEFPIDVE